MLLLNKTPSTNRNVHEFLLKQPKDFMTPKGVVVTFPETICDDPNNRVMLLKPRNKNLMNSGKKKANGRIWPLNGSSKQTQRRENVGNYVHMNSSVSTKNGNFSRKGSLKQRRKNFAINDPESFHCAISPILRLAQFFGILPITGIRSPSIKDMIYKKKSLVYAYSILVIVSTFIVVFVEVIVIFKKLGSGEFDFKDGFILNTTIVIFFGNCFLATLFFLRLVPRWIILENDWRTLERFIDSNKTERPKLRWKFFIISAVLLSLALIEHILNTVSRFPAHISESYGNNLTLSECMVLYLTEREIGIFPSFNFEVAYGVLYFVIARIATFTWNFMDLFIMLVSTGLAERYKFLNKETMQTGRLIIDWHEVRQDYVALSSLVKRVDRYMCPLILLSFGNNLYFVCLQLLNGLSLSGSVINILYFFGSFIFLVGRTAAVTLCAARIHDQSKVALPSLYSCPLSFYNIETQRLEYQLATDEIALTGLRFFSITRNFLLVICGAVVTYEIVLLQFTITMKQT